MLSFPTTQSGLVARAAAKNAYVVMLETNRDCQVSWATCHFVPWLTAVGLDRDIHIHEEASGITMFPQSCTSGRHHSHSSGGVLWTQDHFSSLRAAKCLMWHTY